MSGDSTSAQRTWGALKALALGVALATGCASYQATPGRLSINVDADNADVVVQDVEAAAQAFDDASSAEQAMGITPSAVDMFPVVLRVRNHRKGPIKLDLMRTVLRASGGSSYHALDIDAAVERARHGAWPALGGTLVFGLVGAIASGASVENADRALDADYMEKKFKPSIMNSGVQGQGVIFFDVPGNQQSAITTVVAVVRSLTDDSTIIELPLALGRNGRGQHDDR